MLPAGFEPAISASERPESHTLDGAATGLSSPPFTYILFVVYGVCSYGAEDLGPGARRPLS
jgi:hypothetical protein